MGLAPSREADFLQSQDCCSLSYFSPVRGLTLFGRRLQVYMAAYWIRSTYKSAEQTAEGISDMAQRADYWDQVHTEMAQYACKEILSLEGLWVKLGQFLSTRGDIIPDPWVTELRKLQDALPNRPFEDVRGTIESELHGDIDSMFSYFEEEPIATASIASVHRATLHDGQEVVLKVQHKGIDQLIAQDLDNFVYLAETMYEDDPKFDFRAMLREWCNETQKELDFEHEALNTEAVRRNLLSDASIGVGVPRVIRTPRIASTRKVLMLEYIHGVKPTNVSALNRLGVDHAALLHSISAAYARQIFTDGLFNADPHPGNLLVDVRSRTAVLLDFGLTKEIPLHMRLAFAKLLIAAADNDVTLLIESLGQMGITEASLSKPEEAMDSVRYMFRDAKPNPEQRLRGRQAAQRNSSSGSSKSAAAAAAETPSNTANERLKGRRPSKSNLANFAANVRSQRKKSTSDPPSPAKESMKQQGSQAAVPDESPKRTSALTGAGSRRSLSRVSKRGGRQAEDGLDDYDEKPSLVLSSEQNATAVSSSGGSQGAAAADSSYSFATGKRYPTESSAGSILFMLRVIGCLRGIAISLGLSHSYLSVMRPYAEDAIRRAASSQHRTTIRSNPPVTSVLQRKLANTMEAMISKREARGLQVCVYQNGRVVANLGLGEMGAVDPRPVTTETLFNSFSCGKALCALLIHILYDKGWISSLDDPIVEYWPSFGGNSQMKACTVRMLLEHCSGLSRSMPGNVSVGNLCDFQYMVSQISQATNTEPCGTSRYHMLTYGWLVGGFVQAVAAKHQLDYAYPQLVSSFITEQLGIGQHVMTEIRGARRYQDRLASISTDATLNESGSRQDIFSALSRTNSDSPSQVAGLDPRMFNDREIREACIPSANTHMTAYGLATIYAALAGSGAVNDSRILSEQYVRKLHASIEKSPTSESTWPYGFRKYRQSGRSKPSCFGFNGLTSSVGFADPSKNVAVAVLVNHITARPVATIAVLRDICSELRLGAIAFP